MAEPTKTEPSIANKAAEASAADVRLVVGAQPSGVVAQGARPAAASNLVRLELTQLDLMKLHNIDVQKLTFHAQIWVEFTIRGGALDAQLSGSANSSGFNSFGGGGFFGSSSGGTADSALESGDPDVDQMFKTGMKHV